jgi:predicted DNA-binding WGR domain protein
MNADYDFRDEEPTWVKYAELTSMDHDKFYEVRVDLTDDGEFCLTKRWGRRPDTGRGQIKTAYYQSLAGATSAAQTMLASKVAKGYRECPRPYGASNQVFKEVGNDYYQEGEEAF